MADQLRYATLLPGDPAPYFRQRTATNPRYVFDTAGGRWLVLCLFGSAAEPMARARLEAVLERRALFDDARASFFGVSVDPVDETEQRVADSLPGLRFFWDFDATVSRLYGALPADPSPAGEGLRLRPLWVVIDPTFRVWAAIPFAPDGADIGELLDLVEALPPPELYAGFPVQAPVLVLPRVFEPELCQRLIGAYEAAGGEPSGFMREVEGRTVLATTRRTSAGATTSSRTPR